MDAMADRRYRDDQQHQARLNALWMEHVAGKRCECGGPLALESAHGDVAVVCDGWPKCGHFEEVA